ncbi:MAG: chitobiase/beta-hexosaminidase C-terminal domain-containing protein [Deltaproteobacteria bacterium]|nr:chitobiase/beta-hexosaminidase C-terminal domain-containing protein [Deltaproteobacteria bacterium]
MRNGTESCQCAASRWRLAAIALLLIALGCGGTPGGEGTDSTRVTLSLNRAPAAKAAAAGRVPASIRGIRVTVSGPMMDDVTEAVVVGEGQESVSVTLEVPNGLQRVFTVEATDGTADHVLYRGSDTADLLGEDVALSIQLDVVTVPTVLTLVWPDDTSLASVTAVRVNVTGPDMADLAKTFDATGGLPTSVSLDVPAGAGRTFTITALNTSGNAVLLFAGAVTADQVYGQTMDLAPAMTSAVPAQLSARATAPGGPVLLAWDFTPGPGLVQGFHLYRDGTLFDDVSTSNVEVSRVGLAVPACYEVAAYDAAGHESGRSNQACVRNSALTDAALVACVRQTLPLPDARLLNVDLALLEDLSCNGLEVAGLDGLEDAAKLTSLSVTNNRITALAPLGGLSGFQTLDVTGNCITDFSPVTQVPTVVGRDSQTGVCVLPPAAAPTFSIPAGTYTTAQTVTLSTETPGAQIRYTTDGTTAPTGTTGTLYVGPITVAATQTVRAIAYAPRWADSAESQAVYTITGRVATPTFSVPAGTYTTAQTVTISTGTPGAQIRYTTDGTTAPTATTGTLYTGPITVATTQTVRAIAYAAGWTDSAERQTAYTIAGTVAAPTFSVATGTYTTAQTVAISTTTPGATIRYTTDGTTPTSTTGTVYTGAISVVSSETVKAIAYLSGWTDSSVTQVDLTLRVAAPSSSVASGTYFASQSVALSTTTAGATIRYTADGTTPTSTTGTVYTGAISVASSETLKAIAYLPGWTDSPVTQIDITLQAATPLFSVASGTYLTAQRVALSTDTPGAAIRYTTDGTTPTASVGTLYDGPISVAQRVTVRAVAFVPGWATSWVAVGSYAIPFADLALETCVRNALEQPSGPLASESLAGLQTLSCTDVGVASLEGLQLTVGLQTLDLGSNKISDLRPLAALTGLQTLDLRSNEIADLRPLEKLRGLQTLFLYGNQISDLGPLSALIDTSLSWLDLSYNQISDLSPLAQLNGLTSLFLDSNRIVDLRPLAGLTGLTSLSLSYNQLSDLRPLAELTGLTSLPLSYNRISDLSPLAGLYGLTSLYLDNNQISDLTPLSALAKSGLNWLNLSYNRISDVNPLAVLSLLQYLNLDTNQISDVSPLARLIDLTYLDLSMNCITDFSPVSFVKTLITSPQTTCP